MSRAQFSVLVKVFFRADPWPQRSSPESQMTDTHSDTSSMTVIIITIPQCGVQSGSSISTAQGFEPSHLTQSEDRHQRRSPIVSIWVVLLAAWLCVPARSWPRVRQAYPIFGGLLKPGLRDARAAQNPTERRETLSCSPDTSIRVAAQHVAFTFCAHCASTVLPQHL